MSIADKITRLQNAKSAIATAITNKGGTVSSGDGFEDFATDIGTISTGIVPTGNINITNTASTDVTNYATAQVVDSNLIASNIKSGVSILGVNGTLTPGITPSGTLSITSNGTYNVTNYASASVNIATGYKVAEVTYASTSTSGTNKYLVLTVSGLPANATIQGITPIKSDTVQVTSTGGGGNSTSWWSSVYYCPTNNYKMCITSRNYNEEDDYWYNGASLDANLTINQVMAGGIQIKYADTYNQITTWSFSLDWSGAYVFYS